MERPAARRHLQGPAVARRRERAPPHDELDERAQRRQRAQRAQRAERPQCTGEEGEFRECLVRLSVYPLALAACATIRSMHVRARALGSCAAQIV